MRAPSVFTLFELNRPSRIISRLRQRWFTEHRNFSAPRLAAELFQEPPRHPALIGNGSMRHVFHNCDTHVWNSIRIPVNLCRKAPWFLIAASVKVIVVICHTFRKTRVAAVGKQKYADRPIFMNPRSRVTVSIDECARHLPPLLKKPFYQAPDFLSL